MIFLDFTIWFTCLLTENVYVFKITRYAKEVERKKVHYAQYNILPLHASGSKPPIMELPEVWCNPLHSIFSLGPFAMLINLHLLFFLKNPYRSRLQYMLCVRLITFQCPECIQQLKHTLKWMVTWCLKEEKKSFMICLIGFGWLLVFRWYARDIMFFYLIFIFYSWSLNCFLVKKGNVENQKEHLILLLANIDIRNKPHDEYSLVI